MKTIKIIFRIWPYKQCKNYRWMIRMQNVYDNIDTYFVSDKQKRNICDNFEYDYKCTKDNPVYGIFDDTRFAWCDSDSSWLCRIFDVDDDLIPDIDYIIWPGMIPVLPIPEHVEIADDLKDNVITS